MKNCKSPGCDGLPAEFYKTFFHLFSASFVDCINGIFKEGRMSESQRLGIISLICKNREEPEFLRNWRPISLLNVDYKIITKSLTNRLSQVIGKLVYKDQTCSIPGRSIQDNVHLLRNVLDYVNNKDIDCALLTLDQAKAFDRVSHDFLFQLLDKYNFGPDFKRWIKVIYTDIHSQVLVNGFFTESFPVRRSVRQGCSISSLLYVLYVEPFAAKIRKENLIKGLKLPGSKEEAKISQYADDTTIIITTLNSGQRVFKITKDFGRASGTLLNLNKCWGIWLGAWRNRTDAPFGIKWTNKSRKVCGVQIGNGDIIAENWNSILLKMEKTVNWYSQRNLSYLAKSNIIQAVLCAKLWYVGATLKLPQEIYKKFEKLIFKFFWGDKPEPVSRNTMFQSLEKGGFNIVNIALRLDALHVKHLCSVFKTEAKWKYFTIYWLGYNLRSIEPEFASNLIPHSEYTPSFYVEALTKFKSIVHTTCTTEIEQLTTRKLYLTLLSKIVELPKIIWKYPRVDFTKVWPCISETFVDPRYRDVAWRVAHNVIPTGEYLYIKQISKINTCYFCKGFESLSHLFVFCPQVHPFWVYLQHLLSSFARQNVKITVSTILFNTFQKSKEVENNLVLLLLVNLGKYCIWVLRNQAKFENDSITTTRIISMFVSSLRLRILADFQRFGKDKFKKYWCKNEIFASLTDEKVRVLLKPP